MKDLHDCAEFSHNGEKYLGLVVKHFSDPLNDFYVIYAENTLFEWRSKKDCKILAESVFMPSYDSALADVRVNRQRMQDLLKSHNDIDAILDSIKHYDIRRL